LIQINAEAQNNNSYGSWRGVTRSIDWYASNEAQVSLRAISLHLQPLLPKCLAIVKSDSPLLFA
jgi:hypothetical protein